VKKTYPPAKKKLPKLRRMTLEEFMAVTAANHAKTEAAIDRLAIENEKTLRSVDRLSARVDALTVNVDRMSARVDASTQNIDRMSARVDASTKNIDRMSAKVEELSNNLGYVSNNLGAVVEYIVIPQIRYSINTVGGHSFTDVVADKKVRAIIGNVKKDVTEVDVFLYSDTEAMAVEIKTSLNVGNVNTHLSRLRKLREHEEKLGITHKKLFGAVAGIIIDSRARELALKKGLYVVEIKETEELLDIEKPEECRTW